MNELSKIIIDAKESGQTVIFSTHDLHIAEKVADEVIFLSNGKVISSGPINNYRNKGLYETFQQLYFNTMEKELRVL